MTSHPSPFHRTRQSNKALDPTGQTAKFLYTILKQLDLKSVDWNQVASSLDITNGHAARMRWSRFRAQIEGLDNSYSRYNGKKGSGTRKRKKEFHEGERLKTRTREQGPRAGKKFKSEAGAGVEAESIMRNDLIPTPGAIKNEVLEKPGSINGITIHHPTMTTVQAHRTTTPTTLSNMSRHVSLEGLQSNASHQHRPMVSMSGQQKIRPYNSSNPQATTAWQQHYRNSGYPYPCYSTVTNNTQFHHPGPSNYQYQQLYTSAYPNQYGSPAYNHMSPQQYSQSYQPHHRSTQAFNVDMASSSTARPQSPIMSSARPSSTIFNHATPNRCQSQAQDQRSTVAKAYELAGQASYPWPYSEASMQEFIRKAQQTVRYSSNSNPDARHTNAVQASQVAEATLSANSSRLSPSEGERQTSAEDRRYPDNHDSVAESNSAAFPSAGVSGNIESVAPNQSISGSSHIGEEEGKDVARVVEIKTEPEPDVSNT